MKLLKILGLVIVAGLAVAFLARSSMAKPGAPTFVLVRPAVDTGVPDAPGPVVSGKKGNVTAGDTLPYTVSWGPAKGATTYVVQYVVGTTNGTWFVVADSNASGKWTTGNGVTGFPATSTITTTSLKSWFSSIPWDSATFTAIVAGKNSAGTGPSVQTSWTVKRKPGAPGPIVVDSSLIVIGLLVKPDTSNLQLGTSRVICGFYRYGNGAVAEMTAFKSSCDSIYVKYVPVGMRNLKSAAQQAQTDSIAKSCMTWASSAPSLVGFTVLGNCANGVTVVGLGLTRRFPSDGLRYAGGRLSPQTGIIRCKKAGDFTATAWGANHMKLSTIPLHCSSPGAIIFVNPIQLPTFLADR